MLVVVVLKGVIVFLVLLSPFVYKQVPRWLGSPLYTTRKSGFTATCIGGVSKNAKRQIVYFYGTF